MSERERIEREIIDWLAGIADHADNAVERDLLRSLIDSLESGEHRDD